MKKLLCMVLSIMIIMLSFSMVSFADELLISPAPVTTTDEATTEEAPVDEAEEAFDYYGFSDMPRDWSEAALKKAVDNGLLSGSNGLILASDNLTRAQMAAVLVRAFGATEEADISEFSDVKEEDWFYNDVKKAVKMGWFSGSDGKMRPNDPITREEAFVVLARAFAMLTPSTDVVSSFADKGEISSWALNYVSCVVGSGYAKGSDGKLNPKNNITRAEFAVLMDNIVKLYITEAGTVTQNVEGSVLVRVTGVIIENSTISGNLYYGPSVTVDGVNLKNSVILGRVISSSSYTREDTAKEENTTTPPEETKEPEKQPEESGSGGGGGGGSSTGSGGSGSNAGSGNSGSAGSGSGNTNKPQTPENSSTKPGENTSEGELDKGEIPETDEPMGTVPETPAEPEPEEKPDYNQEKNDNMKDQGIEQPDEF